MASHAFKVICSSPLLIDSLAIRTLSTELQVYIVSFFWQMLLLYLFSKMFRLKMRFFFSAIWSFYKMLFAFCIMQAHPTKLMMALWAFHLGTSCFFFLELDTTFQIWTEFGAILKEQSIQSLFCNFVSLVQTVSLFFVYQVHEVKPVNYASLIGVISLSTV